MNNTATNTATCPTVRKQIGKMFSNSLSPAICGASIAVFDMLTESTELKRFSSESNDIDFIAEITTIARTVSYTHLDVYKRQNYD